MIDRALLLDTVKLLEKQKHDDAMARAIESTLGYMETQAIVENVTLKKWMIDNPEDAKICIKDLMNWFDQHEG